VAAPFGRQTTLFGRVRWGGGTRDEVCRLQLRLVYCYVREDGVEDNAAIPRPEHPVQGGRLRASGGDVRRRVRACRHRHRPLHRRLPSTQSSRLDRSQDASGRRRGVASVTHFRFAAVIHLCQTPGTVLVLLSRLSHAYAPRVKNKLGENLYFSR